MGSYTFELDDKLIAALKQWVIGRHGKLRKRLSKTVERAIKEFLVREMQKEAEKYREKIVGKVDYKLLEKFESASEKDKKVAVDGLPGKSQEELVSAVRKTLVPLPYSISKAGLVRLLVSKGWEIPKAQDAVLALIDLGIYEEDANAMLTLQEGSK